MQFLTSLFGGSGNMWLTALFALGIVIVLIVLASWLLKLLTGATSRVGRGRNRRLSVIDSLALDPKRQLLIIRRDDVEHLILTGGPADVVVEAGIPVVETQAARPGQMRRTTAPVVTPEPASRTAPLGAGHRVEPTPANVSPLDRLRDMGKPAPQRRPGGLHPGLMRPMSQGETVPLPQAAENSGKSGHDSAKESGYGTGGERADFDDSNAQAKAEGRAADRT